MKKTLVLIAILTLALWSASYAVIGIGVRGGFGSWGSSQSGSSSQSGPLIGAHVDFTALPIIGIEVSGTYFWKSQTTTIPGYSLKTTYSLIPLEATGMFKFSIPMSPITPYVGAGPGLYISKTKFEYTPANPLIANFDTTVTKFGIHGAVGANFKLPALPLSFGAQAKYAAIFSDPSTHLFSIVGLVTYNF